MTDGLLGGLIASLPPREAATAFAAGRDVDEAELRALLAAARVAPSADNAQTWRFVEVRSAATKAALAAAAGAIAGAVEQAPVVLVACGIRWVVTKVRREQPFVMIDVPIAIVHILLQAAEIGLACAWSLECDEEAVRRALAIPADVRVIALLALGWPAAAG